MACLPSAARRQLGLPFIRTAQRSRHVASLSLGPTRLVAQQRTDAALSLALSLTPQARMSVGVVFYLAPYPRWAPQPMESPSAPRRLALRSKQLPSLKYQCPHRSALPITFRSDRHLVALLRRAENLAPPSVNAPPSHASSPCLFYRREYLGEHAVLRSVSQCSSFG